LLSGQPVINPDLSADDLAGGSETGSGEPVGEATADRPAAAADVDLARPVQPVTPSKPLIQVLVPYSTLIGADDQPGELVGHGPIPASLAREAAVGGVWRRLVTDPLSGALLDHGRTTYHPPAALSDHVRARDVYCRAPGCRRRVADGELDHIQAWCDGGSTCAQNLGGYCTHHHRLKHHAGWRVEAEPDGGISWTTPTGHRHTTRPHDYRPDPPPPAGPPMPRPAALQDPDPDPPPF
jgi:hypothetical protein